MSKKTSPTNKTAKSKSKEPNAVRQMTEDLNFQEFETRMRQLMRELLEPVIYKSKVDREMIFKLEKTDMDYEKRIDLLEQAVYHKKAEDGSTMFDDMEEKILQMDILLKSTTKQFSEQVEFTEKKFTDEIFKTNQNVYQIQNYQQMIEENKRAVESCQLIVQTAIHDIRQQVEINKTKSLQETSVMQNKIFALEDLCKSVPPKVADCVNQCTTIAEQSDRLVDKIDLVEKKCFQLDMEKFSIKEQNDYDEKIQAQIMRCENATDKVGNHTDELQNWIDIYMPLRLQSQITETIKECLPRKGKYLLGVAAQQMNAQLRERMFTDIGHPDLKKRCLKVIEDLKLEADILTEKDKQMMKEANENWKFDEEAEAQKKQANSENLPKIDNQTGGHGPDADSEVLGKLQEDMEQFAIEECKKTLQKAEEMVKQFSTQTMYKLTNLDIQLNSMNNQQSAFINALKDEVENSANFQRKQNQDTLGLIKGLSTTVKKQKDTQAQSQESFEKLKHTIHLIAQQQNLLSNFVSMVHSDGLMGQQNQSQLQLNAMNSDTNDGAENLLSTLGGLGLKKQQTSVAKFNAIQGRTSKADQTNMKSQLYAKLVSDTQANMKKLQVSLFKNNFKKSLIQSIGQSLIENKQSSQDNGLTMQEPSAIFDMPQDRKPSLTSRKPQQSSSKNNSIAINTVEQGPNYEIREQSPNHNIIQTRIVTKQNVIQNLRQHYDEIQSPHTIFQNSNNNLNENRVSEPDVFQSGQKSNLNSSSPSDIKLRQINNFRNTDQMISSPKLDAATSLRDLDRRLDIKNNNSPAPQKRQSNQSINFIPQQVKTNRVNVRTNAFNHHSITTKDNSKINRYASAMKVQNEDMAGLEGTSQSFDFSVLDPTLNQRNKRGSMPVAAVNVQHKKAMGTQSALGNYNQIQASPFQLADENNVSQGSSAMNQSFGFGPLQISRAKYGSQERNVNQSMMVSGVNTKNLLKHNNMRQSVQESTHLPKI